MNEQTIGDCLGELWVALRGAKMATQTGRTDEAIEGFEDVIRLARQAIALSLETDIELDDMEPER